MNGRFFGGRQISAYQDDGTEKFAQIGMETEEDEKAREEKFAKFIESEEQTKESSNGNEGTEAQFAETDDEGQSGDEKDDGMEKEKKEDKFLNERDLELAKEESYFDNVDD